MMKFEMVIPKYIKNIQNRIKKKGYECYLVGGCVRDTVLGLEPHDYDLTTNCSTDVLKAIFSDYNIINNNGIKHNTITLHIKDNNVEITSFRHDNFEPNSLSFDLEHRDFTINALAYDGILIDQMEGLKALKEGKIVACKNAYLRIVEDPIRILRALRFSSKLGFEIDSDLDMAIHKNRNLLINASKERIRAELNGILAGNYVIRILKNYSDVMFVIIPILKECYLFEQNNPYHPNNILYYHLINTCANINLENNGNNLILLRLAALLHDIGKLKTRTTDKNNISHYYSHANIGANMAFDILKELKYSNDEIERITYLIRYHDSTINLTKKSIIKNFLHTPKQDEALFYMLIKLINADRMDHKSCEIINLDKVKAIINKIKEERQCTKLSDLKINGYDIMRIGYSGKDIGRVLNYLLELVIDEKINNDTATLISKAIEIKNKE